MAEQSRNVLYYGSEEPAPEPRELRAGPLAVLYLDGDLRFVRLGEREILNRIYVAVRDRNWNTIPAALSNETIEDRGDSFHITYDAEHREGDIHFVWTATITGEADGTIRFAMDGEARSTFLRNRIGFCVLHPADCAGEPCVVEHVDGEREESAFPEAISPHQPFKEMRAISHPVAPGVRAEVRMEGDTFEMEDQRNWTDASFKTYCTPLDLPFPVEIEAGTKIAQSITITLQGEPKAAAPAQTDLTVHVGDQSVGFLPRIGLGLSSQDIALSRQDVERLRALHLSHLRVDLDLAETTWEDDLRRATDEADELGARLEVAVHLSNDADAELHALVEAVRNLRPPVLQWLIFHRDDVTTRRQWVDLARQHLADYDTAALFGAGTNAYFTELNRNRPPVDALDLVCYSINPQVHAFDNLSLAETLPVQATTVESARRFVGALPIAVTPITLRPRFNPNATGDEPEPAPDELPPEVDRRQMSLFGAGWTVGSIRSMGTSGVHSVTYYETVGWRGVMESEQGSPLPQRFPSTPGSVFPLYHVLADVGEFAGGEVLPTQPSDPLAIEGIALRKEGKTRLILANLSGDQRSVRVEGVGSTVHLRHLDERTVREAMNDPESFRSGPGEAVSAEEEGLDLELLPFAVVCADW